MTNKFTQVSVLVLAAIISGALFVPGAANAANATFNTDPQDKPTLRVSNYTQNQDSSTSWASSIQNVQAGEVVSFVFYYHNTSSVSASNTRANIALNYNANGVTATGKIWATNASPVYGNASFSTAGTLQNLSLSFHSAKWYPNQNSGTAAPLPSGQSGAEITSASGVGIGNIGSGWSTQGYLVVRFTVNGVTPQTNPDFSLSASPSGTQNVMKPGSATYAVSANTVSGTPSPIALSFISGNANITGSFSNQTLSTGQSTALVVNVASNVADGVQSMIVRGIADGKTHDVTLTINVTSQTQQTNQATLVVSPTSPTVQAGQVYQFFATYDPDGPSGAQAAQDVTQYANWSSSQTNIASSYGSGQFYGNTSGVANISGVYGGLTATALLTVSGGSSGTQAGAPLVDTKPALNVAHNAGTLAAEINPNNAATTYYFEYGTTAGLGLVTYSGNIVAGAGYQMVYVPLSGLTQGTKYYFRIVAQNAAGTRYGGVLNFTTYGAQAQNGAPIVQTDQATNIFGNSATLNGGINSNGADTTYRFEYGATSGLGLTTAYNSVSGNTNGTQFVSMPISGLSSNTTYYFRLVGQNVYGTSYGQIMSFNSATTQVVNNGTAPFVVTNNAAYVTGSSGFVSGSATSNYGVSGAWFEYGTNASLTLGTATQYADTNGNFSFVFLNLNSNTTYYYRAAASNQYGTGYGSVLSFHTNAITPTPTPTPAPTPPPTPQVTYITNTTNVVNGGAACVTLVPAVSAPQVASGEEFDYSVTFRNDCSFALSDALLSITLPSGTKLISTNLPFALKSASTQVYDLGTVPKGYQGTIVLRNSITNESGVDDAVLYTSTLTFNDAKNISQSISANINVVVTAGGLYTLANVLAIFGGLSEWLLLLLILAALALYMYYRNKKKQ